MKVKITIESSGKIILGNSARDKRSLESHLKSSWIRMQDILHKRERNYLVKGIRGLVPLIHKEEVPLYHEVGRFNYYKTLFEYANMALETGLTENQLSTLMKPHFTLIIPPGTRLLDLEESS